MKNKLFSLVCACAVGAVAIAQNIPNPVIPRVADAGVMKYNGKYYIGGVGTYGDVYVSDDLIRWSEPIHVVTMDNDWTRGSKAGNNIRLYNNQTAAELNFTITAPSSLVRWTAELLEEGDGHYFEFDGPSSGEVFIGDATSAPMQAIKVRVINPDDEDYHEATLRVVATLLNGESYELDLTGESGTAPGTAGTINRYTLIQAR